MCNVDFSRSIGATESLMRDCHFEQPETLKDEIVFQVRILRDAERKREQWATGRFITKLEVGAASDVYMELTGQMEATGKALDGLLAKLDEVSR